MGVGRTGASVRPVCGVQIFAVTAALVARRTDGHAGGGGQEFGEDRRQEATAGLLFADEVDGKWNGG